MSVAKIQVGNATEYEVPMPDLRGLAPQTKDVRMQRMTRIRQDRPSVMTPPLAPSRD